VGGLAELATLRTSLTAVAGLAFVLGLLCALIPLPGRGRKLFAIERR
jgi:hypothetical protein